MTANCRLVFFGARRVLPTSARATLQKCARNYLRGARDGLTQPKTYLSREIGISIGKNVGWRAPAAAPWRHGVPRRADARSIARSVWRYATLSCDTCTNCSGEACVLAVRLGLRA